MRAFPHLPHGAARRPPLQMSRPVGDFLASSIGKKIVMGCTGLLLVGFLVMHLAGNLTLYADADGHAFNAYCEKLQSLGPLLLIAELLLGALFLSHIYLGVRLTMENRDARHARYEIRSDRGRKTAGSATMFLTGACVLAFLIKHLIDFRFHAGFQSDPAASVKAACKSPATVLIYVVAMGMLGLHLSHAIQSAFQTFGLTHPRWKHVVRVLGLAFALLVPLAFASLPLRYFFAS